MSSFGKVVNAYFNAISHVDARQRIVFGVGSIAEQDRENDLALLGGLIENKPNFPHIRVFGDSMSASPQEFAWIERKFNNSHIPDDLRARIMAFKPHTRL